MTSSGNGLPVTCQFKGGLCVQQLRCSDCPLHSTTWLLQTPRDLLVLPGYSQAVVRPTVDSFPSQRTVPEGTKREPCKQRQGCFGPFMNPTCPKAFVKASESLTQRHHWGLDVT